MRFGHALSLHRQAGNDERRPHVRLANAWRLAYPDTSQRLNRCCTKTTLGPGLLSASGPDHVVDDRQPKMYWDFAVKDSK